MGGFWRRNKQVQPTSDLLVRIDEAKADLRQSIATVDDNSGSGQEASRASGVIPSYVGPKELTTVLEEMELEPRRELLDEQVEVVGETFHVKGIKKVFRGRKVPITASGATLENLDCVLIPEPWNPHDGNAVAVMVDGQLVGYLPAELAGDYAAPLAQLASQRRLVSGETRIWAKAESPTMIRARVTICIPEASEI